VSANFFVLYFKINYKCEYGYSLYVSGNIEALGNWNPSKALKLNWSEGHFWSEKLKLTHENTKLIEYKYFVAPTSGASNLAESRWENGPNRLLNLRTATKLLIKLHDEWEKSKIKVCLSVNSIKETLDPNYMINFNSSLQEGCLVGTKLNKYAIRGGKVESFWTTTVKIPNSLDSFVYQYQIINSSDKEIHNDRYIRKFQMKKYPFYSSGNELYMVKGSTYIKFDFNYTTSLKIDMITSEIYIGSYPQTIKDIDQLKAQGITAILNLQTMQDLERYCVDWPRIKSYCQAINMIIEHFPIIDMDPADLKFKCKDAVQILHKLLHQGKRVYVHCTAGRNRSTHIVINYLWTYEKYDLEDAITLVQSKRGKFKIVNEIFQRAS